MIEAVLEDHAHHDARRPLRELCAVMPCCCERGRVADFDATQPREREHARRGRLPVDMRDDPLVIIGEVARKALRVLGLAAVVELGAERSGKLGDKSLDSERAATSRRCAACRARCSRIPTSASTCAVTPGRRTFTTTSAPDARVAACTWPIEAAASGVSSKVANSVSTGRPSSDAMTWRMVAHGSGGTASCSRASSR